jgi:NAD(P)H dehydrogenase (quinone)
MTTLIIYAHPNIEGHCSAILNQVEKKLKTRKEKYETLDLYKMKFDPILHEDELYSSGNKKLRQDIDKIQKKILSSDKLIFIYPIWWNSPPAILRGFADRVFSAGFGFRYEKTALGTKPIGLLKGKRAVAFHTSASPSFFFKIFAGSRGSKILIKDTLKFCGIKAKGFHYGNAKKIMPETDKKLDKLTTKGINWLY